jgi:hypothetical protein
MLACEINYCFVKGDLFLFFSTFLNTASSATLRFHFLKKGVEIWAFDGTIPHTIPVVMSKNRLYFVSGIPEC